ncbi:HesA/MoeB/ThiF family protein [Desulforamulus ruminis]
MELVWDEYSRYHRQMILDRWGETAQKKLKESTVFIAGAGGLGSPVAFYLTAVGTGTLKICDPDVVDISNLNRQILHNHARIGMNKVLSAQQTLEALNNSVQVIPLAQGITSENADFLVGNADIILDCLDHFAPRYALMKAALRKKIPYIYGSIWGMEGRLTFIQPPETPCLKCIFPEPPPQNLLPVVGATAGVIGSLQALEAVKYLIGAASGLKGRILYWDGGAMDFRKFEVPRDPACRLCGG